MAVSKRGKSTVYYTDFSINGIRVRESTGTNIKSEAQRFEEKRRAEIREQIVFGSKPKRAWLEAELRWFEEMKTKRSLKTDVSHFIWLSKHLRNFVLDDISKDVIETIAKEKEKEGASPATVNRTLALIRSVLNRAYKQWEWINRVPHIRMRPEKNARIRWLTKEEVKKLLVELPRHLRAMARMTLATGLRAMNVSYLEWSNVSMDTRHLVVLPEHNKSKKHLGVPLNDEAMEVLKEQLNKDPKYVFVYRGKPVTQCSTKAWRHALKRAGIENFRWHDLRHTWASWHVQSGTTLQELFELGGWSSFEMVLRYAHLSSSHLRNAADRLNDTNRSHGL